MRFDTKAMQIRGGHMDNLLVSLDYDEDPGQTYPVLLFTPDMANTNEHYHIELSVEQATVLRDWLNENV